MELSDEDLCVLQSILWDAIDYNNHYPESTDAADRQITSDLYSKVRNEAKQRRLWWAR